MKPKRISKYQNLSTELKGLFATIYNSGDSDAFTKFVDPRDQQEYKAVMLETEEFLYMVKVDSYSIYQNDDLQIAELSASDLGEEAESSISEDQALYNEEE